MTQKHMAYKTDKTHFILIKTCQTKFKFSNFYFEKLSLYYLFLMSPFPLHLAETVYLATYV